MRRKHEPDGRARPDPHRGAGCAVLTVIGAGLLFCLEVFWTLVWRGVPLTVTVGVTLAAAFALTFATSLWFRAADRLVDKVWPRPRT